MRYIITLFVVMCIFSLVLSSHARAQDIYVYNDPLPWQDEETSMAGAYGLISTTYDVQFYYDTRIDLYLFAQNGFPNVLTFASGYRSAYVWYESRPPDMARLDHDTFSYP
jgi:hypothetical protein